MAISHNFDLQEVITALIKHQDIHAGEWVLNVNFGLTASNIGQQGTATLRPGVIAMIEGFALTPAEGTPGMVSVDAAKVNPSPR